MKTLSVRDFRVQVLERFGVNQQAVIEELLHYNKSPYAELSLKAETFPMEDEPHLERWRFYKQEARELGAFEALKQRFTQLRFPIREGMSSDPSYWQATRKGKPGGHAAGLELEDAEGLDLFVHPTMAGHIPVLVVENRKDFESLVQAFTERNEPVSVPTSMGACLVSGLNNWDRITEYRIEWERGQNGANEEDWLVEFKSLVPRKKLYQDRFIILSSGPYSGIPSPSGLTKEEWLTESLAIRREHELTHYFTHRLYGVMRNNLLDEIVADFVGLVRTRNAYPSELAAHFLGLEDFPRYREGGRLENYLGNPPVSNEAFQVLQQLSYHAIINLSLLVELESKKLKNLEGLAEITHALLVLTLEELASDEMLERMRS